MYVKAEKCEFSVTEVEFLGFRISLKGVFIDQSKALVIVNWPTPKSVHNIQVFLGLLPFYPRLTKTERAHDSFH